MDTDIAPFIFKGSDLLNGQELALLLMTVAELFPWAILRQWGDRRLVQLEQYRSNYLIIPVDQPLCRQWAQVRSDRQSAGRPISPQDAWIAATALRHDLPLITHNIKDFLEIPNLARVIDVHRKTADLYAQKPEKRSD